MRGLRIRRHTLHRLLAGGGLTLLATAVVAAGPATLAAADEHEHLQITGIDLAEPLELTAPDHPERYAAVHREVAWLINREPDAPEPDSETLGPQYTLVLHAGEQAHRFHLYPLAQGGPKVFRPAEQPGDRSVDEAWHFARLSLPETLQSVGVPLTGDPAGIGGGRAPDATEEPESDALGLLDEWLEGMLLTVGIAVAVLAGVASIAYLLHRGR